MRWKRLVGTFAFLIIAFVVLVYTVLATYDYNNLKPSVARMVKNATGRELRLGGEINLDFGFSPSLVVTNIALANDSWGSQPQMIEIEKLQAQVRLIPLLFKNVKVKRLGLFGVKVLLETGLDEQGNWDFFSSNDPDESTGTFKPTAIDVDQVSIENLQFTFIHQKTGAKKQFALASLAARKQQTEDALTLNLTADYNGHPLTLSGKAGSIRHIFTRQHFPLQLSGNLVNTEVKIRGTIDDVLSLQGISLDTRLTGKNLAKLGPALGIKLPETQKFDSKGHLKGSKDALRLENIFGNLSGNGFDITVSGSVGNLIVFRKIDLKLESSGEDLAVIASFVGAKIPATDEFKIQGRLTGSKEVIAFNQAHGSASRGSMSITANGSIKDLLTFRGIEVYSSLKGNNLEEFGAFIGEKLPATDEFAVEGRLTGATDTLSLKDVQGSASLGDLRVAFVGGVRNLIAFSGLNLQIKGAGKSLTEMGRIIDVELPATDEFEVQGRLEGSTNSLSLRDARGSAKRGGLNLAANGGVEKLLALDGIKLKLKTSGKELAEIGSLIETKIPTLGPFEASGKISGSAKSLSIDDFEAIVDNSDFKGRARFEVLKRPKLTVRLQSSAIDFTALMKSLENDEKHSINKNNQTYRLFSDAPLPLDSLKKIDADIVLKVRNIHAKNARLDFGHMTVKLQNHDLSIDKIEATYKQTKISGNIQIKAGTPAQVETHFLVQDFNLGDLLKETGKNDQIRAIIDIAAHGKSRGNSMRSLMANLDGAIGVIMGEGYLTKYLDLLSSGLTEKVFQIWKPDKAVDQIKCAVVQFDIDAGVAASQAFVFETQAGLLIGEGEINLGTETINFLLMPKPAHPELTMLTNLRVRGTVMDPLVSVDKASALTRSATALSALAFGPLGLLAPFVHLGANQSHACEVSSIGQLGQKSFP